MNSIVVSGRLGQNPEFKTTQAGDNFCHLNLAVSKYMGKEKETKTIWLKVACFKFVANACKELKKGDLILVSGEIDCYSYLDKKTNLEREQMQIVAREVGFISSPEPKPAPKWSPPGDETTRLPVVKVTPKQPVEFDPNDIPF